MDLAGVRSAKTRDQKTSSLCLALLLRRGSAEVAMATLTDVLWRNSPPVCPIASGGRGRGGIGAKKNQKMYAASKQSACPHGGHCTQRTVQ